MQGLHGYSDLVDCLRLSLSQKTTLIDHLRNEHRYMKHHLNDYSIQLQQRQDLLGKLADQFQRSLTDASVRAPIKSENTTLLDQYEQQRQELTRLKAEYEKVQVENDQLRSETQAKIERYSCRRSSNAH
jgi:archaellum component FlaC